MKVVAPSRFRLNCTLTKKILALNFEICFKGNFKRNKYSLSCLFNVIFVQLQVFIVNITKKIMAYDYVTNSLY